jgi:hypothetical protein
MKLSRADLAKLEAVCGDDPDALVMLRKAVVRPAHRLPESQRSNDNIISKSNQGTSRSYTLTRLQQHRRCAKSSPSSRNSVP